MCVLDDIGFTHVQDGAVLDDDGAVGDDPAALVEGDDEIGIAKDEQAVGVSGHDDRRLLWLHEGREWLMGVVDSASKALST